MSPRRPRPAVHTRRNTDGTTSYYVRYRDPTRRVQTTETFTTRTEADIFAADIHDHGVPRALTLLDQRTLVPADAPTLGQVCDDFLTWKANRTRTDRTLEEYRRHVDSTILPGFGFTTIDRVDTPTIQRWVDALVAGTLNTGRRTKPLAPKTVRNHYATLHAILAWAASPARGIIVRNPADGIDLPPVPRTEPKALRPAETAALHAAFRQLDPDAADLTHILHASGARFGEATALHRADVLVDGDTVTLAIGHVMRRHAGGRVTRVADVKTDAGFRAVALDRAASAVVLRRLVGLPLDGFVFTTSSGTPWLYSTFARRWADAVAAAHLTRRPTPHWLRHTHVAELLAAGVPLPLVQQRIGHANIGTTVRVYGRQVDGVGVSVLDAIVAARGQHAVAPDSAVLYGRVVEHPPLEGSA